ELSTGLPGLTLHSVERRGKYLILSAGAHYLLIHLGMSGSLRVLDDRNPAGPHDHVDIVLSNGRLLRYTDPRRFGCLLWGNGDPLQHPLLKFAGPEPLSGSFTAAYLHERAKGRK